MKGKAIVLAAMAVGCIAAAVFFRPLPLSKIAGEESRMSLTLTEIGVRNGEPYIDSKNASPADSAQKSEVFRLLEAYAYRRTPATPFSDGSVAGLGNRTLSIYVYDADLLSHRIFVTSTGEIAVDDKGYRMDDAKAFIEQMAAILELSDGF